MGGGGRSGGVLAGAGLGGGRFRIFINLDCSH